MIDKDDETVRGALTRAIARLGHAPEIDALAAELSRPSSEIARSLQRLADAHALLLHPGTTRPWVVHPFALSPGSCWVETARGGYWANCLYCACGIAAAMRVFTPAMAAKRSRWFFVSPMVRWSIPAMSFIFQRPLRAGGTM